MPAPVVFTIGPFPFTRPPAWKWVIPSSAMRKVQLVIPSSGGGETNSEKADVSFFTFGSGQGGSVQSNVERWERQFSTSDGSPAQATTESHTIGSVHVTFVSAYGTFTAGMSDDASGPKNGYALRGAIIENSSGSDENVGDVFVKMTGPEKLVLSSTPAFDSMITKACKESGNP